MQTHLKGMPGSICIILIVVSRRTLLAHSYVPKCYCHLLTFNFANGSNYLIRKFDNQFIIIYKNTPRNQKKYRCNYYLYSVQYSPLTSNLS